MPTGPLVLTRCGGRDQPQRERLPATLPYTIEQIRARELPVEELLDAL